MFFEAMATPAAPFDSELLVLCDMCGCQDIYVEDDGHYYCQECGAMIEHLVVTASAPEDIFGIDGFGEGSIYNLRRRINVAHNMCSQPPVKKQVGIEGDASPRVRDTPEEGCSFEDDADDPMDFGSGCSTMDANTTGNMIAWRYVQGMQLMIQMQCEALVKKSGVNPLVYKVVEDIWLRFVASKRVLDGRWADKVILESEAAVRRQAGKNQEPTFRMTPSLAKGEPHNMYGQRSVYIWLKALRKAIPLHSSLAISFLSCHVIRESVLPTDVVKWALESKVPFVSAFINIDKLLGRCLKECPLSSMTMFRPFYVVGAWQLERMIGMVAESIGLRLSPVNFHAIAVRFLNELLLPLKNILPTACKIYEWSMPTELCFSTHNGMIPTRVYVMAILVVTVRMLYKIHGQGVWEMKIASSMSSTSVTDRVPTESNNCDEVGDCSNKSGVSSVKDSEFSTEELLRSLETIYYKINDDPDFSNDYASYLKYCKEIICAGINRTYEEERLMQNLWTIYEEDQKEDDESLANEVGKPGSKGKLEAIDSQKDEKLHIAGYESSARQNNPDDVFKAALQKLKQDMQDNGFHYLHPTRKRLPNGQYLYYRQKLSFGRWNYVAHADYYLLLRTCAKLCQVDCRVLQKAVLSLEKRLDFYEKRIISSLISIHDGPLMSMIQRSQAATGKVSAPMEVDSQEPAVRLG